MLEFHLKNVVDACQALHATNATQNMISNSCNLFLFALNTVWISIHVSIETNMYRRIGAPLTLHRLILYWFSTVSSKHKSLKCVCSILHAGRVWEWRIYFNSLSTLECWRKSFAWIKLNSRKSIYFPFPSHSPNKTNSIHLNRKTTFSVEKSHRSLQHTYKQRLFGKEIYQWIKHKYG